MPVSNSARINIEIFPFFNSEKYKCQKKFRVCYSKEKLGKKISRFCPENSIHAKKKNKKFKLTRKMFPRKDQPFYSTNKFKGPFLGLRQFLTIESPWKMMKNAFNFMLKLLFCSWDIYIFGPDFFCPAWWENYG